CCAGEGGDQPRARRLRWQQDGRCARAGTRGGSSDRRNHPWGQACARTRAPGAGVMRIRRRAAGFLFILIVALTVPGLLFAEEPSASVKLLVGRSAVVDVGTAISRVSLTSSDVADAMVTSGSQLLVNGKMPGTISMFVW